MPFCVWKCIPDVSLERYVLHVHLLLHHLVLSWSLEPVFWVVCLIVGCPLPSSAFSAPHQVSQALSSGPLGGEQPTHPTLRGLGTVPEGRLSVCRQMLGICPGFSNFQRWMFERNFSLLSLVLLLERLLHHLPPDSDLVSWFALSTKFKTTSSNRILWEPLLYSLYPMCCSALFHFILNLYLSIISFILLH